MTTTDDNTDDNVDPIVQSMIDLNNCLNEKYDLTNNRNNANKDIREMSDDLQRDLMSRPLTIQKPNENTHIPHTNNVADDNNIIRPKFNPGIIHKRGPMKKKTQTTQATVSTSRRAGLRANPQKKSFEDYYYY